MSSTIVSLRGTHGSGKSTVVFDILSRYPAKALVQRDPIGFDEMTREEGEAAPRKKHWGYLVKVPGLRRRLFIVGRYATACGGCDGIQPYADIWPRIEWAALEKLHVLFEGALVSSSYGNIGRYSEMYGDRVIFAFLDTPLKKCLERIAKRRAARGNFEPVNPANTEFKFHAVAKSMAKISGPLGRMVVTIDHRRATDIVLSLYGAQL